MFYDAYSLNIAGGDLMMMFFEGFIYIAIVLIIENSEAILVGMTGEQRQEVKKNKFPDVDVKNEEKMI